MRVEAGQIAVKLEEDVLGQVLGVRGRAGEPVADGVNAPVLRDDKLLPGLLVARHALAHQLAECLLRGLPCHSGVRCNIASCLVVRCAVAEAGSDAGRSVPLGGEPGPAAGARLPPRGECGKIPDAGIAICRTPMPRYTQRPPGWFNRKRRQCASSQCTKGG